MSVMQVVGSSRISNTVYLGVASIYWTLYITLTGFTLNLDVQTALLLVTPPAGIAAVLWILRIEDVVITQFLLRFLSGYGGGRYIRYYMGYSILYIQPWKEYFFDLEYPTISDSLKKELNRIIRTPQMKTEIETLHQFFWLLFTIPAIVFLLNITIIGEYGLLLFLSSLIIDFVLVLVISFRKRAWPMRILGMAFCVWTEDTLATKKRRRDTFSPYPEGNFPLETPQFYPECELDSSRYIANLTPWLGELLVLAKSEDWIGFKKNLDVYLNSQQSLFLSENQINITNSLVSDAIWSVKRAKVIGPIPTGVTINPDKLQPSLYIRRIQFLIPDAIAEIQHSQGNGIYNQLMNEAEDFIKGWVPDKYWYSLYRLLSKQAILKLTGNTARALVELPFFLNNPEIQNYNLCQIGSTKKLWTLNIIICLQKAINEELISPEIVFDTAARWKVLPKDYIEECSPKMKPLILEKKAGLPAIELKHVIRKVIRESGHLDTDKVATNLIGYREDSEFTEIIKQLKNLTLRPGKTQGVRASEILAKMGVSEETEKKNHHQKGDASPSD